MAAKPAAVAQVRERGAVGTGRPWTIAACSRRPDHVTGLQHRARRISQLERRKGVAMLENLCAIVEMAAPVGKLGVGAGGLEAKGYERCRPRKWRAAVAVGIPDNLPIVIDEIDERSVPLGAADGARSMQWDGRESPARPFAVGCIQQFSFDRHVRPQSDEVPAGSV